MSDSVSKYFDNIEDSTTSKQVTFIYESPDKGDTVTRRPIGSPNDQKEVISKQPILSEGTKKQAYRILVEFQEEAILEAARILLRE